MKNSKEHNELIAAYHAGRLSPEDAEYVRTQSALDPAFAEEVALLAPVAQWLRHEIQSGPSANYRLSDDRLSVIRAAARGDIVSFPERSVPGIGRRSRFVRAAQRYGLATAAAVAMMIGAVSGFESGRIQFADRTAPFRIAVDAGDLRDTSVQAESIHFYSPAYGLDHTDLSAIVSRGHQSVDRSTVRFAESPQSDLGLPGPASNYLRSKEILFLQ